MELETAERKACAVPTCRCGPQCPCGPSCRCGAEGMKEENVKSEDERPTIQKMLETESTEPKDEKLEIGSTEPKDEKSEQQSSVAENPLGTKGAKPEDKNVDMEGKQKAESTLIAYCSCGENCICGDNCNCSRVDVQRGNVSFCKCGMNCMCSPTCNCSRVSYSVETQGPLEEMEAKQKAESSAIAYCSCGENCSCGDNCSCSKVDAQRGNMSFCKCGMNCMCSPTCTCPRVSYSVA